MATTISEMRKLLTSGGMGGRGANNKFVEKFIIELQDDEVPRACESVKALSVLGEAFKAQVQGLFLTDRRLIAVTSWSPRKFTVYPKMTFFPFDLGSIVQCVDRDPDYEIEFSDGQRLTFERFGIRHKSMSWFLDELRRMIPPAVSQPQV